MNLLQKIFCNVRKTRKTTTTTTKTRNKQTNEHFVSVFIITYMTTKNAEHENRKISSLIHDEFMFLFLAKKPSLIGRGA